MKLREEGSLTDAVAKLCAEHDVPPLVMGWGYGVQGSYGRHRTPEGAGKKKGGESLPSIFKV